MSAPAAQTAARPSTSCVVYGGWKELDEEAPVKMPAAKNDNDKRELEGEELKRKAPPGGGAVVGRKM